MEKFSYSLEFYKYEIFSLDNPKLYKRKVLEAEKIENYFAEILPNVQMIRKYIIRSFRMKPRINVITRINYIIGLVYADDYISNTDLEEFENYIDERKFPEETEMSVWWLKGYYEMPKDVDFFGNGVVTEECLVSEKSVDIKSVDEEDKDDKEEINVEDYDYQDDLENINPEEKIKNFKKHKREFINLVLKNKNKDFEEEKVIRRAMNDWINFCIETLEEMYRKKKKEVEYKMQNISKFL